MERYGGGHGEVWRWSWRWSWKGMEVGMEAVIENYRGGHREV